MRRRRRFTWTSNGWWFLIYRTALRYRIPQSISLRLFFGRHMDGRSILPAILNFLSSMSSIYPSRERRKGLPLYLAGYITNKRRDLLGEQYLLCLLLYALRVHLLCRTYGRTVVFNHTARSCPSRHFAFAIPGSATWRCSAGATPWSCWASGFFLCFDNAAAAFAYLVPLVSPAIHYGCACGLLFGRCLRLFV